MSSDKRPQRTASAKNRGGTIIGIFIGLVLGVAIAAVAVWFFRKMPTPFVTPDTQPPASGRMSGEPAPLPGKPGDRPLAAVAPQSGMSPVEAPPPTEGGSIPGPTGTAAKSGTESKEGEKPRFDFYKVLPGTSDAMPTPDTTKNQHNQHKEAGTKETATLQTGSFQDAAEADNQKAKLALMGVEAQVQQVMLQEKVWYRVRIGPYRSPEEVSKIRADLAKAGIDAVLVKN